MKLFSIWVIAILLLQAFAEASSFSSASAAYSLENVQVNEGSNVISVNKINCDHACSEDVVRHLKRRDANELARHVAMYATAYHRELMAIRSCVRVMQSSRPMDISLSVLENI
ncbi:Gibberellin-regulated protein 9 [Quillaja saponaria]|uniref:Gibberellin-regulated protein 9 n=1 Tax=Quillaja saponaria TaxID=32244 RepID=A0AAD7Q325_QUISA|nr:Gibberellin-regulated protein 9 [Quillaja saponaria]